MRRASDGDPTEVSVVGGVPAYAETLGFRGGFFNRALRDARVARGLTQKQLAKVAGTTVVAVSHAETLRQYPGAKVAARICAVLGAPVETLLPAWLREFQQTRAIRELPPDVLSLDAMLVQAPKELAALSVIDVEGEAVDRAANDELLARVDKVLDSLSSRESQVMSMRFGLGGERRRTLKETGAEFNLTANRIMQIEEKALRKLRHPARSRQLRTEAREPSRPTVAEPMAGPFACRWPRRPKTDAGVFVRQAVSSSVRRALDETDDPVRRALWDRLFGPP